MPHGPRKQRKLSFACGVLCIMLACSVSAARDQNAEEIVRKAAHVTPSAEQLALQDLEFYAFIHFNLCTFLDGRGFGTGKDSPELFNPTQFDARQWVRVCKAAGMKMIVLVVKHHEGFCLWPSKHTEYSVKSSPWRDGKGDVVKDVSDACREAGLKFGVYLSPWDKHEPTHGKPAYDKFFKGQLRELLSDYGEITLVWFDGYGSQKHDHDWLGYHRLIRKLQPKALIRTGLGPSLIDGVSIRWFGLGEAARGVRESEWSVIPIKSKDFPKKGHWREFQKTDIGSRDKLLGAQRLIWWPAEFDIPIRKRWFYRPDDRPKSLKYLLDVYFRSVGRNATFMLNLSPDRRGLIPDEDIGRLKELRTVLDATFKEDLARGADAQASDLRSTEGGLDYAHDAAKTVDGDTDTYWTVDEETTTASLEYDLGEPRTFNLAVLQEYVRVGQRIEEFALDIHDGRDWKEIARGTVVGYKRILRFDDVTARRVRIRILQSRVCPTLSNFGLFRRPAID
ncbi:MAG: alpha-L-fucosidase [Planctomycetota bacterium]|nr:alpha-L-fucosidase [Planctomycetota bacterium]